MSKKDGNQSRTRRRRTPEPSEDQDDSGLDARLFKLAALLLIALLVPASMFIYDNYVKQMFYPRSDPALREAGLGENESLVLIQMISPIDAGPVKDIYVRINNPATGERWEYYTDGLGEVWVKVRNTELIHVYQSKPGWHSEITNIVLKMGANNTVQHVCKPFEKIRFYVQVGDKVGEPIQGAEVYFDGSADAVTTDDEGLAFVDLSRPRKVAVRVVSGGETYETSYTILDWWVWDKLTIFFD